MMKTIGTSLKVLRQSLRRLARRLKQQVVVVYLAARDPRTPWRLKALAWFVAAYALSPIDLIPDFVPILGYLDDLIIVPLGLWLVLRWLPAQVLHDALMRAAAMAQAQTRLPATRWVAVLIVLLWIVSAVALVAALRSFAG
jgi:uncharacterized membrane protein YkvA (DUF1232 family)